MISLTINNQTLEVPDGSTVLQAAEMAGIAIPTLCFHKDLSPYGGCRLCVVEVQGTRLPMTSCILPINPGMVVNTESEALTRYRKAILRMLLQNYYDAGYKRNNGKLGIDRENELAHWAEVYGIDIEQYMAKKPAFAVDSDPNPFVWVDLNKCIQCTRCVRACAEIQGRFVWSQSYRGYKARIVAGSDTTMLQARCESCGACVAYCPTGALDNKMSVSAGLADRLVRTTCAYCGVGCQLDLNVLDNVPGRRVIRVTSNTDPATVNKRHLCLKGRYGYDFIHSSTRLTQPRVRQYLLDSAPRPKDRGKWVDVDWETALRVAANGLVQAWQAGGSDAIGILGSGNLLNEESYLLGKLARQVIGTNQIDCCAHIYASDLSEHLLDAAGIPAMQNPFDEIASKAGTLLVIGSNLTEQHPVFGAKIRQAILRRKIKMVVVSPDFFNIAEYAALPLYPKPNTEAILVQGLIHIILEKHLADHAKCQMGSEDITKLKEAVAKYSARKTSDLTGVAIDALYEAAEILTREPPLSVIMSDGLADRTVARQNMQSLINLQRLLGSLDTPGGGVNFLGSQNNIRGAGDLGSTPNRLPGYQNCKNSTARAKFEQAWGVALSSAPGLSAWDMLKSVSEGKVKALYIAGEDALNVSPDGGQARRSLDACEFVVYQTSVATETARYANVLLPGVTFAEKTGSFTNAERRIQMVHQAIEPIGAASPDWQIFKELAKRILPSIERQISPAAYSNWDYTDTAEIMQEIAALTPIYYGVSHSRLDQAGSLFWPVESEEHPGTTFLQTAYFEPIQNTFIPIKLIVPEGYQTPILTPV